MVAKDEEFVVVLAVQYVAYLRPIELCSLTTGQVIRPRWGSGTRCWALLLAPQEDLKASKTAEFDESILLDRELSVCTEQNAGELHRRQGGFNTLLEPITGEIRSHDLTKWAEISGVSVTTTHPYSVRHGEASSDAR